MKKIKQSIILFSISIFIFSCGVKPVIYMNSLIDNMSIGMTIDDFKKNIPKDKEVIVDMVEMNPEVTIYKVTKPVNYYAGTFRFFYFENNKLVKIDKGERAVDYRIKID